MDNFYQISLISVSSCYTFVLTKKEIMNTHYIYIGSTGTGKTEMRYWKTNNGKFYLDVNPNNALIPGDDLFPILENELPNELKIVNRIPTIVTGKKVSNYNYSQYKRL